ncbi:MAG: type II toxin-antitoxin system VapB family antitoxin [Leptospiraceae bacterium]|nr:type II toxin-antitoxin system VapB family antitoxin [Leptospiraceae bacterium]MCP5499696.1 type II toxin-antitoxin system VapB family antitoxin [Leptospiraceae bacterium]
MKRKNLVLDEELLEKALQLSSHKTYSATVNEALEEFIRVHSLDGIIEFQGSGIWEGNLSSMRKDSKKKIGKDKGKKKK